MNWWKTASVIDNVQVAACSDNHIVILLMGRRYEYSGLPGCYWGEQILKWKGMKNKFKGGQQMSGWLRNFRNNLVQPQTDTGTPKPEVMPTPL